MLLLVVAMMTMAGCTMIDRLTDVLYPTPGASEPYPRPPEEGAATPEAYPSPAGVAGRDADLSVEGDGAVMVVVNVSGDGADGDAGEQPIEPQEIDPYADSPWRAAIQDEWGIQFMQGAKEWATVATVVARFVDANSDLDDETLSQQLGDYLALMGDENMSPPQVRRLADGIYLAHLPPMSIYLLEGGEAALLADGDRVLDIRFEGDEMGLIFGATGMGPVQPAFVLLRRADAGNWQAVWTPLGQRDWVATDGEIRFMDAGLDTLEVVGTSFGLDEGIDQVFAECQYCIHRRLAATWQRQGDTYVRQTELADDASVYAVYWEMTGRTPYAVLHESLRRLRQGLPADELLSGDQVVRQIRSLELLDAEKLLVAVEETDDTVVFAGVENERRYRAQVKDGRLIKVERAGR
jgi:hypothetical protein